MATEPEEVTGKSQVTGRQLALVLGGAVVLLALVWFLFLRGGGEEPTDDVAVPPPVTTPTVEPPGDGPDGDDDDKPPVETTEVFAPRDPFDPLLSAEGEGDGTDDGTGTDEGTDTDGDGDVDGDDGTDTDGDGDVDGDDGTDTSEENVEGHRVQLIGISGSGGDATAQIQVDDTVYTVSEGERFAENFELLSTSGECATLLYGDDQFTVCEGEEILK